MAGYAVDYGSDTGILADLLGDRQMSGRSDPQDYIRALLDDMRQGEGNQYAPRRLPRPEDAYEGNPNREPYLEEMDPYQVAGDVVPMRTHPPSIADVLMRLQTPGVSARSKGMQTIERFGGSPQSIDLMDVLNMLGRGTGK